MNRSRSETPLGRFLLEQEKAFIIKHLQLNQGNISATARAIGLSHRQISRKIAAYKEAKIAEVRNLHDFSVIA